MFQNLKKIIGKIRRILNRSQKRFTILRRDLHNRWKYGASAPLYNERIWVDPKKIEYMIEREEVARVTGLHRSRASGVVVDWSAVENIKPVTDEFRIRYCYQHWEEGKSWEELGVIDHMSRAKKYKSWPKEKIKARFEMLDQAFIETQKERRLKTREEINPSNFRETDGILVHIGTNGRPFFGGNGFHRLAISKVLKLDKIPACVGLVDRDAIKYLDEYRKPD